jgi:L-lactate utilization protein LutB
VVVAHCEPCPSLEGYKPEQLEQLQVVGVKLVRGAAGMQADWQPVRNLRSLASVVLSRSARNADIWLQLADNSVVVLGGAAAAADARDIAREYGAPGIVSRDLADLLVSSKSMQRRRRAFIGSSRRA